MTVHRPTKLLRGRISVSAANVVVSDLELGHAYLRFIWTQRGTWSLRFPDHDFRLWERALRLSRKCRAVSDWEMSSRPPGWPCFWPQAIFVAGDRPLEFSRNRNGRLAEPDGDKATAIKAVASWGSFKAPTSQRGRGGRLSNSGPKPSATVRCAMTASRSFV